MIVIVLFYVRIFISKGLFYEYIPLREKKERGRLIRVIDMRYHRYNDIKFSQPHPSGGKAHTTRASVISEPGACQAVPTGRLRPAQRVPFLGAQ